MKVGGLKKVEKAHDDSVWALAWTRDTMNQPLLLTGSLDETVRVWNHQMEPISTLTGHCLGVVSLSAHPDGQIAASSSLDSFVRVFNVHTNLTISTVESPPSEAWQLRFNPQGTLLAVGGGSSMSVKLWDTTNWQLYSTLSIPQLSNNRTSKKFVMSIAWSPDGKRLACGSMDGTISVFDIPRSKFLHHLEGHFLPVRSLVYSPSDPQVLFSASDDAHIHIYDSECKSMMGSMSGHSSWVLSVDVSPDGDALVTGSSDSTVKLWDLRMRASLQTMTDHTDQVWEVAFGRHAMLASVSDDSSISLYDYS